MLLSSEFELCFSCIIILYMALKIAFDALADILSQRAHLSMYFTAVSALKGQLVPPAVKEGHVGFQYMESQ